MKIVSFCGTSIIYREKTNDTQVLDDMNNCPLYDLTKLKNIKTVLDIGAHIGTFSIKAVQAFPHADIYAFEPFEENFTLLKANTLNFSNIHIYQDVICGAHRPIAIREYNIAKPASRVYKYGDGVACVSYLRANDLFSWFSKIDILKIDCEGGELEFLDDIPLDKVRYFIAELHLEFGKKRLQEWVSDNFSSGWEILHLKEGKHIHISARNERIDNGKK